MTIAPSPVPIPCTAIDQSRLYDLYTTVPTAAQYEETLRLEERWINPLAEGYRRTAPAVRLAHGAAAGAVGIVGGRHSG
ncbi:hypothetical protein [Streptomyces flavidovirens]|uniref:hypothetical protein n=1 Tax=Streptomyces flavidovirens TaxID=67298 RepID=UPI00040F8E62|nr:hypothetical protein [Streptomyces flavidovirens]